MAKYIKTEEGYKLFREIEDNGVLSQGNLIEIKDNEISCTLGKPIKVLTEVEYIIQQFKSIEFIERDYISFKEYNVEIWGGENFEQLILDKTYTIKIRKKEASSFVSYDVKLSDTSNGNGYTARIDPLSLVFDWFPNRTYIQSSSNSCEGADIQIIRKDLVYVDQYVKLPTDALSFDEVPTLDSDNLLTSGSVYTALEDVQNNIKSDIENGITTEYIGSSCTFGDTTVMAEGSITVSSFDSPDFQNVAGDDMLDRGTTYIIHIGNTEYTGVCQSYDGVLWVGNGYLQDPGFFDDTGEPFVLYQFNIGDYNYVRLIAISTNELSEGTTYTYSIIKDERETVYKSISPFDLIKQIEDLNDTTSKSEENINSLNNSLYLDEEALHQVFDVTNNNSDMIVGQRLIELDAEYMVIFDGIEYRLPCVQNNDDICIGNSSVVTDTSTYPFKISQMSNGITNLYTTNAEHTCTLYKIDTKKFQ